MENKKQTCCSSHERKDIVKTNGIVRGLFIGFLPHIPCLAFFVFSVIGAVAAAAFFRDILFLPHFFSFLIAVSVILSVFSSIGYLWKKECLCIDGMRREWKYLAVLFGTTIAANIFFFSVAFPVIAERSSREQFGRESFAAQENLNLSTITLTVNIPCSGHAPLIIDEMKKNVGIVSVRFIAPNRFIAEFDSEKTNPEEIQKMDVFRAFPITVEYGVVFPNAESRQR